MSDSASTGSERTAFEMENNSLGIERAKLDIEKTKLQLEQSKIRWTAASVIVPLLAAVGTLLYGFWNTKAQAELTFQLEAAKSVMQTPDPETAQGRAEFLKKVFPRLPPDFFKNTDLKQYQNDGGPDGKLQFVKLVAERGALTPRQISDLWRVLFTDSWARDEKLIQLLDEYSNSKK